MDDRTILNMIKGWPATRDWHVFTECLFFDHYRIVFDVRCDRVDKKTLQEPKKSRLDQILKAC